MEDREREGPERVLLHVYTNATIWDSIDAGTSHPLIDGVVVKAGPIKVKNYKSDSPYSIVATIIKADGTQYTGSLDGTVVYSSGYYVWNFKWINVPSIGCTGGIIRFADAAGNGTTTNLGIAVTATGTCP